MPELPEVETIRLQLDKYIKDSRITDIEIRNKKYEIDKSKALGTRIIDIRRFAKQLSIDLDNKYSIMIHVKMTGQLVYKGQKLQNSKTQKISDKVIGGLGGKHTHVIFHLDNGDLYYNDVRQFGWIRIIKSEELTTGKSVTLNNNFAPEPLKDLTLDYFTNLLSKARRNIKTLLMDQTKIGGIGNIYVNDALWASAISPKRVSNSLTNQESKLLFKAIHTVLKAGLKYGGSSESSYVTPDGKEGDYQNHTLVYGRTGKPCLRCNTKLEKFFLGGRGTYICPKCQK